MDWSGLLAGRVTPEMPDPTLTGMSSFLPVAAVEEAPAIENVPAILPTTEPTTQGTEETTTQDGVTMDAAPGMPTHPGVEAIPADAPARPSALIRNIVLAVVLAGVVLVTAGVVVLRKKPQ
jgi:hypothetical protein